ncbi:hypothetical protein [Polyangium mundeleinium]|uniref:Uncharacterized protein n=1 Tax=Polyangium mundeleinium TaxID=2995306 RepID=A0ABT5F7Z5_9BACT|nr:hypothetical protein [Polyangium mundeleinium]MDC0749277.1 hypothetical protein [Polyangium mundeleinium]
MGPLELNKLEESATGRAIDAVLKGQAVLDNFVDFTSGLVRNVFGTLVDSTMEQLEAYAELVASVSGSLQQYEQRTFPNLERDTGDVIKYIANFVRPTFADTSWTTFSRSGAVYTPTVIKIDAAKLEDFKAHYAGVVATVQVTGDSSAVEHTISDANVIEAGTMPAARLYAFTLAKFRKEIKASYDKLLILLKLGMQKLVITEGRIMTKMTFHVTASESDAQQSSSATTDYTVQTSHIGGRLSGSVLKRAIGFQLGGSRTKQSSTIKVNVVNEQKTAVTTLDTDIMGAVELKFRSDYFPSFDPEAPVGP